MGRTLSTIGTRLRTTDANARGLALARLRRTLTRKRGAEKCITGSRKIGLRGSRPKGHRLFHPKHGLECARARASSLAKRVSIPEKLETAMKSEITARSAESRTDSEVAFSPSCEVLIDGPCDAPGHPANRLVEDAAADRLDFRPNLWLGGPAVRSPFVDPVLQRPLGDGDAVGDGNGEHHFLTVGGFSGHGETTRWRFVTEAPARPDARFSARGSGWPARPRRVRNQWNACSGRSRCSEAKRRQMSVDVSFQKGSRVARAAIVNEFFPWRTEQTAFPAPLLSAHAYD